MAIHLTLLALLGMVGGALAMIVGVSLAALAAGAATLVPGSADAPGSMAAGFTAAAFLLLAGIAVAWGAANLGAGIALRRRHPWARLAGLALGVLNLFVLPFGTALGIYGLWVLLNDRSRQLLDASAE